MQRAAMFGAWGAFAGRRKWCLDATLGRVLIVPSTMRLLGHLNWWAPPPIAWALAGWRARHPEDLS